MLLKSLFSSPLCNLLTQEDEQKILNLVFKLIEDRFTQLKEELPLPSDGSSSTSSNQSLSNLVSNPQEPKKRKASPKPAGKERKPRGRAKQVLIEGIKFNSIKEVCQYYGLKQQDVYNRRNKGELLEDIVAQHLKQKTQKPVVIRRASDFSKYPQAQKLKEKSQIAKQQSHTLETLFK